MKTITLTLLGLSLAQFASAETLASWDNWTSGFNAESLGTGFNATFTNISGEVAVLDGTDLPGQVNDSTYGETLPGASAGDALRTFSTSTLTAAGTNIVTFAIDITNNSGYLYELDTMYLDFWGQGTMDLFSISYEGTDIGSGAPLILSNVGWKDLDIAIDDAGSSAFTLNHGATGRFIVTLDHNENPKHSTKYGWFDNVAITGIQGEAVPEPSAYALLAGMFGLMWVMVRRRL